jgi:two-component system CheB/CheR fusion protein
MKIADKKDYQNLIIVGLGASAGGFEALQKFIQNIELSDNVAYVIVQHLDPRQPTLLGSLLEKFSKIPIIQIHNKMVPKANVIYLCPPNSDLLLENMHFLLVTPLLKPYPKPSINRFFKSLALEKKDKAIGVILSGTGSDGAEGVVAIKQAGGLALAENENAKYFSMPKAAIDTHAVDAVLPPNLLAQGIIFAVEDPTYFEKHFDVLDNIDKVFRLLNQKSDVDFSDYKESTIYRRLERRIVDTKSENVVEYISLLQSSPSEIMNLKKELLIIVTSLFRDKEAFEALSHQMEDLLVNKTDENIRIWISACATGDEAYTIAIILNGLLKKLGVTKKVTIFATDVSEEAIDEARNKSFTKEEMKNVSAQLTEQYFYEKNDRYVPSKAIRDMIVFSKHDVIKDPPFLNLDMVSCRNLLIYFNSELQQRVLSIFYYALRYDGLLFLGLSESIGGLSSIYSCIDTKYKIYKKTNDMARIDLESLTYFQKTDFKNNSKKLREDSSSLDVNASINTAIGSFFGENGIVVDSNGNALYYKGENRYIAYPQGLATNDIYKQIADFLRLDLRATISEAIKNERVVVSKKIRVVSVTNKEERRYVVITVFPLLKNKLSANSFFVTFDEVSELNEVNSIAHTSKVLDANDINILENELTSLKERLQITIEELETSNEELQSTNEELQSTNEELQSTNEELETSNEELQSTNEELRTVNDELEFKNKELGFVNEALHKVVEVINTDVLILDQNLDLFLHTKGIEKFFEIKYLSKRINLNDIIYNSQVVIPNLFDNVRDVIQDKIEINQDLILNKRIYWFQIKRIKFSSNEWGVVIGFTDKTEIIRNQEIMFQQSKLASMGEMIGNIAHQWRQPLNTLSLNIFALEKKFKNKTLDDNEFISFSTKTRNIIEHMSNTINDFRDFFNPNKEEQLFSLNDVVNKTKTFIKDAFANIEISIDTKVDENIQIYGYENEFAQVIINVLNNSKDAIIKNQIENGLIQIEILKRDDLAIINIMDNAGGSSPETLLRVFEPYFTTKDKKDGTGIGLYMSKMIIENSMQGTIKMQNYKKGMKTVISLHLGEKK